MPEPESATSPGELGEFAAVAGIFRRPADTFAALVRKPTWWLPFVAGVLISALFSFVMTDKVDYETSMRQALEKRSARGGQSMSAAETEKAVDRAVEMQRRLTPYYPTLGAAGYSLFFLLVALVLAFSANAFGAEAKISAYLAIYSYAQVPLLLRSIVGLARLLGAADGSLTFEQIGRLSSFGPAVLVPASSPAALLALASSLDVFMLATLALVVIGFRRLPGLSRASATGVPVGLWGLFVLVRVCWAALFG